MPTDSAARAALPTTPRPATPPPREPGRPWPIVEAAEWLGVSTKTVARLLATSRLKALDLGDGRRRVLITDASLRALAEGR